MATASHIVSSAALRPMVVEQQTIRQRDSRLQRSQQLFISLPTSSKSNSKTTLFFIQKQKRATSMANGSDVSIIPLHQGPNSRETLQAPLTTMTEKQVGSLVQDEEIASSDASSLPSDPPAGYPKFAELMSVIPETAVFRRFGALNALNLLYLQAELIHIEQDLREVQLSDHRSQEGDKSLYAKNWFFLSVSEKDGDEEQIQLVERAREKLDRYNAALIQQKEILAMKGPSEFDRDFIRKFLASKDEGLNFALTGTDLGVWGSVDHPKDCAKDLVALCPRHDEDRFSKWVTGKGITKFFHLGGARFRKRSPIHGFVGYEESDLLRITYNITTILASVLPIAAIAVLAYVQSMKAKLGIIAAFNVMLSVCLTVLTKAKRTDVFAVAAAFSAVQVVFVQSGMSGAGDGQ